MGFMIGKRWCALIGRGDELYDRKEMVCSNRKR